jgi:hypothetical protein
MLSHFLSAIFLYIFNSYSKNHRDIYHSIIDKSKHIIHIIVPNKFYKESEYTSICAGLYLLYNREIEKILIIKNNISELSDLSELSEYYKNNIIENRYVRSSLDLLDINKPKSMLITKMTSLRTPKFLYKDPNIDPHIHYLKYFKKIVFLEDDISISENKNIISISTFNREIIRPKYIDPQLQQHSKM